MAPADLARPLARPAAMPPACVGHALVAVETGGYLSPDGGLPGRLSLCAELCEAAYKRSVLLVWPLAKH
jgi:hypothetical protein